VRLSVQFFPVERYAYVAALAPDQKSRSDALLVVVVDPASESYGEIAGHLDLSSIGDELHHFGWNACSSALCGSTVATPLQTPTAIPPDNHSCLLRHVRRLFSVLNGFCRRMSIGWKRTDHAFRKAESWQSLKFLPCIMGCRANVTERA
jgi:hypothetical protein